jgi:serralysin
MKHRKIALSIALLVGAGTFATAAEVYARQSTIPDQGRYMRPPHPVPPTPPDRPGKGPNKPPVKGETLVPMPTTYQDFDGALLNLYAWEGAYTALLSRRNDLSSAVMASILKVTDQTYQFYQTSTGYTPALEKVFNGKATIADVPTTCGAGCGYLGATGIELLNPYFDLLYNGVATNNTYDQVVFYEFGRNFWNLSSQLAYLPPDSPDAIVTGFAVFMRFLAMEATGVQGSDVNGWTFEEFRLRVEGMIDLYLADPTQTWENTLRINSPQANNPSGLGGTDLFASFLFRLRRDYGGDAFTGRLWHEAALRPAATTTQEAVDNFFLAASAAANRNLTMLFTTQWRWPISASAQAAASIYPN